MDTRKKFVLDSNGVLKVNPHYRGPQGNQPPQPSTAPQHALAIVSSTQDIMAASDAHLEATGQPMRIAESTKASINIMQDANFIDQFQAPTQIDGGEILEGLSNIFAKYEVPVGLINKLLALTEYSLNFIVDDSGSMGMQSDALIAQGSLQMKQKLDPYGQRSNSYNKFMTRWEEAEDRLHILIDMLAYLPINEIKISFLNRPNVMNLSHTGKSVEQFAQDAHHQISQHFQAGPSGNTPVYKKLSDALLRSVKPTMHYLLTDGVPSDASIDKMKQLVLTRPNPQQNPLTFLSCTDQESEAEWMKVIEGIAPFTAELDDFISETKEVLDEQGPTFPFSRGFWLLCQLVAAINPNDLDALDESTPLTKQTMDNLLGRHLTIEEYFHYFDNNPNAKNFARLRQEFAREDLIAAQIVGNKNQSPQVSLPYPSANLTHNPNSFMGYQSASLAMQGQQSLYPSTYNNTQGHPNQKFNQSKQSETPAYQNNYAGSVASQGMFGASAQESYNGNRMRDNTPSAPPPSPDRGRYYPR